MVKFKQRLEQIISSIGEIHFRWKNTIRWRVANSENRTPIIEWRVELIPRPLMRWSN